MSNVGKVFEKDFKDSIPEYCLVERFKDTAQSYNRTAKFTAKNPCDFLVFNTKTRRLFFFELKTTKYNTMSFDDINKKESDGKMIKKHQIEGLDKFYQYDNVEAGFLLNFRDEKKDMHRTYYISIDKFKEMCYNIDKVSFNEIDLIKYGAMPVVGNLKRVHYTWDIGSLMDRIEEKRRVNSNKE